MCLGESVDHACIVVMLQARLTRWAQQEQSRAFGRMSDAIQEEAKNGKTKLRDAWRQACVERKFLCEGLPACGSWLAAVNRGER